MKLDYQTAIYGISLTGKTYLGLHLLGKQRGLKFFIDTKDETRYHGYFDRFDINVDEAEFIFTPEMQKKFNNDMILLTVNPKKTLSKQLEKFCEQLFLYQRSNPLYQNTVLIDELPFYGMTPKNNMFMACYLQGLSKQVKMMFTSQGWGVIHKRVRMACEINIVFDLIQNDIKDMMDQGLIPYTLDSRGWRKHDLKFKKSCKGHKSHVKHSHDSYISYGIGSKMRKIR